jgi:hypothetical protein
VGEVGSGNGLFKWMASSRIQRRRTKSCLFFSNSRRDSARASRWRLWALSSIKKQAR